MVKLPRGRNAKGNRLSRNALAEIERDLSAAEAACSPMERKFCHWLMALPPAHGYKVKAARLAGYQGNPHVLNATVQKILTYDRIIALLTELTKKKIRSSAPQAIAAVLEIIGDAAHRDRLKAAETILERIEPTRQKIDVSVKHEIVDRDKEMVAYLRKLRALGVSRDKLEDELGYSDLPRYERLLELEDAAKDVAPVIEGEFSIVNSGGNGA
jgi:hypothetical protein